MTSAYEAIMKAFPDQPMLAVGIMSNIVHEGSFGLTQGDYQTLNTLDALLAFKANHYNDSGHAFGMCQWDSGRKSGLLDKYIEVAQQSGGTLTTEQMAQIECSYLIEELQTTEKKAAQKISQASSASEATIAAASWFERCAEEHRQERGPTGSTVERLISGL